MSWDKKTAIQNTASDTTTNPSIISTELIDCVYEYGVKKTWYKSLKGTVKNLVDMCASAQGYVYRYDLDHARSIVENAINWETTNIK